MNIPTFRIANSYFAPLSVANPAGVVLEPETGVARFRWYFPVVPYPVVLSGSVSNDNDTAADFQIQTGRDWSTGSTLTAVGVFTPSATSLGTFGSATTTSIKPRATCPFFLSATALISTGAVANAKPSYLDMVVTLAVTGSITGTLAKPVSGKLKLAYSVGEIVAMGDGLTDMQFYTAIPTGGG